MPWKKIPLAVAGLLILFPVCNLIGWLSGNIFLVQFRPDYSPLVPNASLLFILAGVSLLAHIRGRHRLGFACALAVLAAGIGSGLEYLTDRSFSVDNLFLTMSPPYVSGFPALFSPNAALCFILSALALALMNRPAWFHRARYPVGFVGSIVSALGGMALLGYLFDVEAAYSWGRLAKMSLFSALAFWLLGLSIMISAWRRDEEGSAREPSARFMAICLAVGTAAASLVFWKALILQEHKQAQRAVAAEMEVLESELRGEMHLRIQAMERMGQRWEIMGMPQKVQWEYDAILNLRHLRGYQALEWVDTSLRVRWVAPVSGNEDMPGKPPASDGAALAAMSEARLMGNMQVSHASDLPQGGRGFLIYDPVLVDGVFDGFLVGVFRFQDLFREIVPASTLQEYSVAIFDGRERIYPDADPFNARLRRWNQSGAVDFRGTSWRLEIQPRSGFLQQQLSNLPHMVVAGGFLIAILMAMSLHYGQRAFSRAVRLRQINSELESSRENFAAIVERNADGIVVADAEGIVRFANPMAAALLGRSVEELTGRPCPFSLERGPTRDLQVDRGGAGRMILEISVTATAWEGKSAAIANLHDISERVRTREALRQSEAKLRRLVDSNIVGVFFADGEGVVREANEAFLRLVDYTREDLARGDVKWAGLMSSEFARAHEQAMTEIRIAGISAPHETMYLRRNGGTVWVLVAAAALGDGQGTVAFVVDIQDRKAAEEALIKNEEQLRQSQKMEAVGRLAGGVAHDFNNLLTAINGYSDILLSALEEDSPHRPAVEEIKKAGDKAAALTKQLLAFSRKQVVIPKILDANAVVSDMVTLIRRLIGEDINLQVVLDPEAGRFKADAGLVQQVILNLAINSRDAMPEGGVLRVETAIADLGEDGGEFHLKASPGRYAAILIKDTGWGMDASVRSHLFEPFFSTKEKGKGTGLGLSTVYGIVKQFNGAIKVETALGKGTTFIVYFPSATDEIKPEASRTQTRQPAWGRGRETILLVEDEEAVRKLTRRILEEKGYLVAAAADAGEALAHLKRDNGSISLMLTDVIMPGMSGRELADRVRESRPDLRVVFMSGYTDDEAVRRGLRHPGTAFIAKPFNPEDLVRTVREVLDAA